MYRIQHPLAEEAGSDEVDFDWSRLGQYIYIYIYIFVPSRSQHNRIASTSKALEQNTWDVDDVLTNYNLAKRQHNLDCGISRGWDIQCGSAEPDDIVASLITSCGKSFKLKSYQPQREVATMTAAIVTYIYIIYIYIYIFVFNTTASQPQAKH